MSEAGEGSAGAAPPGEGWEDHHLAEQARTLRGLLMAGAIVLGAMFVLRTFTGQGVLAAFTTYGTGALLHAGFLVALRRRTRGPDAGRSTRAIAVGHCVTYLIWITAVLALNEGGMSAPAAFVYPPLVLMTGLVWSGRAALGMAVAVSLAGAALVWLERSGLLPPARGGTTVLGLWLLQTACVVITAVILNFALNINRRSTVEALRQQALFADERLRLENQLFQAQRLEALGRLAGGVAHDFNNLLTVILGNTDLVPRGSADDGPIEEIRSAAVRGADLTRQLLAFGRRQVFTAAVVDLNEVLAAVAPILRRLLPEDVALNLVLADGMMPISTDRTQLEQVVMNLVANARDALTQGGTITVATSATAPATLDGESDGSGDDIWLVVEDDGAGMSPEIQRHVFEPFFTTKSESRGTGLGLATVHGIVAQSGGHIHVRSTEGRGTSFFIGIPRAGVAPTFEARPSSSTSGAAGPRAATVLLVEDEAAVRNVGTAILAAAGYQVLVARNGQEAMAVSERFAGPIELLMTDVVMPGLNGPRLAAGLRQHRPRLKVLFTSGHAEELIGRKGVLLPGVNFLAKPFTRAALLDRVAGVLRSPELGDLGLEAPSGELPEPTRVSK